MKQNKNGCYTVGREDIGKRADAVMARAFPDISRTHWARLFDAGHVRADGVALVRNSKLKAGNRVEFQFPNLEPVAEEPVEMPLKIRYEDEHLLVLVKDAGVVVHQGAGETGTTLVAGLLHHCQGKLSGIGGVERPGIVHRLDRETSGLMVVAKDDVAHRKLSEAFAERKVLKEYLALVQGTTGLLAGSWRGAIGRHPVHRHKMQVRQDGREARTDWQREECWGSWAMRVRCRLHTGRTHQIRVHWSDAGHPLLGDATYGFSPLRWQPVIEIPRVMLHAAHLGFHHPVTTEWLTWQEPLPEDMLRVERALGEKKE